MRSKDWRGTSLRGREYDNQERQSMRQRSYESEPADAPGLQGCLASDAETTADLQDENTADLTPIPEKLASEQASLAVLPEPVLKQHALGFFAFAACTIFGLIFTTEKQTGAAPPKAEVASVTRSHTNHTPPERNAAVGMSADLREKPKLSEVRVTDDGRSRRESAGAQMSLGSLVFESRSFATSEKAVAAVFIVKRMQVVRGTALVHWAAFSGSADAGIDFSDASGTARFADGQRQLAIYVPLRNDLLKEKDETFKVCLRSPRHARVAGRSCAEATIRDDDDFAST
jgi:hypothetical protein